MTSFGRNEYRYVLFLRLIVDQGYREAEMSEVARYSVVESLLTLLAVAVQGMTGIARAQSTTAFVPEPIMTTITGVASATQGAQYNIALGTCSTGFTNSLSVSGIANACGQSINWNQDQQEGVSTINFDPQNTVNSTSGPWSITIYHNTPQALTPSLGRFGSLQPLLHADSSDLLSRNADGHRN